MFGNLFSKNKTQNKKSANNKKLNFKTPYEPVVLVILDGFGISDLERGNAVLRAETPFLDLMWTKSKRTMLHASGVHVGLPDLEAGNSEVGHLNLGSGQVVYQSLPQINDDIRSGAFNNREELVKALEESKKRGSDLHLMGILSDGGVHGHIEHLYATLTACKEHDIDPIIHCFTDGRDTGMTDGVKFMKELQAKIKQIGVGRIATVSGRLYAMDRDKRWERTQLAYDTLVGESQYKYSDPVEGIKRRYEEEEHDQILQPFSVVDEDGELVGKISDNDVIFFFNFREDRARQITKAFVAEKLIYMDRPSKPQNLYFLTMTGYGDGLDTKTVYESKKIHDTLSKAVSDKGYKQLHISETEKYMHVTYFFNGGVEDSHPGEDFFNIPSPKVFDYSEEPPMSAEIVKDEILYRLARQSRFEYKFILVNFANPDMLGHTGDIDATVEGIETVDQCLRSIVTKTLNIGGSVVTVADHGNCEVMIEPDTGKPNTYHTLNPVPLMITTDINQLKLDEGEKLEKIGTGDNLTVSGMLADVAPTVLYLMDIEKPESMTGLNILEVV